MISALLVDDEAPARGELRYLLGAHPDVRVVAEAASAREALDVVERDRPDVVFLDVELPGPSGLDAAPRLSGTRVVFVTAHERYAVRAFAVEAFDYLLKPVDPERLARVVERLREAGAREAPPPGRVPVVSAGRTILLQGEEIHWARAEGDYARVHTYDRSYLSTLSLRELEERLPPARFLRIHRSYLVNLAKVASVSAAGGDRLRLGLEDRDRTQLDVARRQTRAVRTRLRL